MPHCLTTERTAGFLIVIEGNSDGTGAIGVRQRHVHQNRVRIWVGAASAGSLLRLAGWTDSYAALSLRVEEQLGRGLAPQHEGTPQRLNLNPRAILLKQERRHALNLEVEPTTPLRF